MEIYLRKNFLPKVGPYIFTFPLHIKGCRSHYEDLKATREKSTVQSTSLCVDTIALYHRRGNSVMGVFMKTGVKTILRQTTSPPFSCLRQDILT